MMLAGKRIMSGRDTIWSTFGVLYLEHQKSVRNEGFVEEGK